MSIAAILEAQEEKSRRTVRSALAISIAGHVAIVLSLAFLPEPSPPPLPKVITARLVRLVVDKPERIEVAPVAPVKRPVPRPTPTAAAATPNTMNVLIPKTPSSIKRLKKLQKPPKPKKPKELDYVDAMAALRAEMGESEPPPASEQTPDPKPIAASETRSAPDPGFQVSPEVANWMIATEHHIRQIWITPPEFLNRDLRTELRVNLSAAGDVLGTPKVVRSSGDPFWDDNTIRAMMRANPLPPPPEPGFWPFIFAPK